LQLAFLKRTAAESECMAKTDSESRTHTLDAGTAILSPRERRCQASPAGQLHENVGVTHQLGNIPSEVVHTQHLAEN